MATPQSVRHVIFDIGWVLVRLNYRPLLGLLGSRGAELGDRNAVMARIGLEELIDAADLVTEMALVKHHFAAGVKAQPGIEF